ncbi:bacteriocin immunity protein [Serratia marcescens]|uniref:Bacteriocin immunity protein n=2 Tax=Serratia marcescens TaxID=615 RepID=A0ABX5NHL4_SERMA|nr:MULTISPECIES: bacteriocin immunity protein [Serratia]EGT0504270.1 bacteriocin immunity protein [Serratia marcescens]EHT9830912.1 bacteriocin immunity protein [Serratia marcescens]EIU0974009.1 bacteriocin immunity protein [Serratia marcescens]EMB4109692.1 bacteriocin immunity protein [Serratia marcescens]EMB7754847.1 bacteriocin immunity protein [Serratia marcescens]
MENKMISDYTEKEFLEFVNGIYYDNYPTEESHINAVIEFERLSEHPSGSDLLYYPEDGNQGPEAIVKVIKEWRAKNGKPGFKQG